MAKFTRKVRLIFSIGVFTLFMVICWCGWQYWKTDQSQQNVTGDAAVDDCLPGVLRIGVVGKLLPIDLFSTSSSYSIQLMDWIFDGLMTYDTNGDLVPNLAESYEVSPDGLTYTFKLRKNLLFHDNIPVTVEDVVYTYECYRDPKITKDIYCDKFRDVKTIVAISSDQVKFSLKTRSAIFLYGMTYGIFPKRYVVTKEKRDNFTKKPIGTGLFQFDHWRDDGGVEIVGNSHYHFGPPRLKRMMVKCFVNNNEQWKSFIAEQIDFPDNSSYHIYHDDELQRLKKAKIVKIDPQWIYIIYFNPSSTIMSDENVRLGVYNLIDRRLIANSSFSIPCEPITHIFPEQCLPQNEKIARKATKKETEEYFMSSRWQKNENGWFEKDRIPLAFTLVIQKNLFKSVELGLALRQWFTSAGIRVNIVYCEEDPCEMKIQRSDDAFIVLLPWKYPISLWTVLRFRMKILPTTGKYCSDLLNALDQVEYQSDFHKNRETYAKIENILMQSGICFPLAVPCFRQVVSNRFQGDIKGFYESNCTAAAVRTWHVE